MFNVVGPGEVPVRVAIRETGGKALSVPEPIARPLLTRMHATGLFPFPPGALEYLKYLMEINCMEKSSCSFGLQDAMHGIYKKSPASARHIVPWLSPVVPTWTFLRLITSCLVLS